MNREFWKGKRVFLTGHTGFKGGWLALWLADMGAQVHAYALAAPTEPNFFSVCGVHKQIANSAIDNICDGSALCKAMRRARPEIVLHPRGPVSGALFVLRAG